MEKIAGMLAYLGKNFDGSGHPQDRVAGTQIPLGARMLRVVRDMEERAGRGYTTGEALRLMQTEEGVYDARVLAAALACFGEDPDARQPDFTPVAWTALQEGDTLADDIPSETGALLLTKGCRVTPNLKRMLQQMANGGRMPETVRVLATHRGGRPTGSATLLDSKGSG
jgi:hypothetical protein